MSVKENILLFLKGMAMGAADVVPGVSGGTIAFITGIYEKLLDSIKAFDRHALQLILKKEWKAFWDKVNGNFLLVLVGGILVSILTFAKLLGFFLVHYPIQLWSFFFGLIVISSIMVAREVKQWTFAVILSIIAGTLIAYVITEFTPSQTPEGLWFIFISGALAICAMILPGISGSFIMLLLGKYTYIINALNERNLLVIVVFALGCISGLLGFSRILSYLLKRFHAIMIAFLAGFMIGSLNKIWPWKETLETFTDRHGVIKPLIQRNVWPTEYQRLGHDPQILYALLFGAVGVGIVVLIERISQFRKPLGS